MTDKTARTWAISEREILEQEIRNAHIEVDNAQSRLQHLLAKQKAWAALDND